MKRLVSTLLAVILIGASAFALDARADAGCAREILAPQRLQGDGTNGLGRPRGAAINAAPFRRQAESERRDDGFSLAASLDGRAVPAVARGTALCARGP